MTEQQRPKNCICTDSCSTCSRNTSTSQKGSVKKHYFGEMPDDLEEHTNQFIDKIFKGK